MTAGGNKEADIATPTSEPVLSPNTDNATPAPDGNAIKTPTHKLRVKPLKKEEEKIGIEETSVLEAYLLSYCLSNICNCVLESCFVRCDCVKL